MNLFILGIIFVTTITICIIWLDAHLNRNEEFSSVKEWHNFTNALSDKGKKIMIFEIFALALILGFVIGFVTGGFMEWDRFYPLTKELRRDLYSAYMENEALREHIHASSQPIRRARG